MAQRREANPEGMTNAMRMRLQTLLDAVPEGAGEDHPALLALLEAWEAARVPSDARPHVQVYRGHDRRWLIGDVRIALAAIRAHVAGNERSETW